MKIITNSYFMLTLFVLLSVQTLFAESKDTTTVKLSTSNSLSNIANNASLNTENDSATSNQYILLLPITLPR
ncbi:MAG: hypothetical protein IPO02_13940 [Bacteroidetes bacterium]|nr:hypothetical protein [Bacteroidota bacterium]